jgi:hypothetical protein
VVIGAEQGDQANSEAAERLGEAEAVEAGEAEAIPLFREMGEVWRTWRLVAVGGCTGGRGEGGAHRALATGVGGH